MASEQQQSRRVRPLSESRKKKVESKLKKQAVMRLFSKCGVNKKVLMWPISKCGDYLGPLWQWHPSSS